MKMRRGSGGNTGEGGMSDDDDDLVAFSYSATPETDPTHGFAHKHVSLVGYTREQKADVVASHKGWIDRHKVSFWDETSKRPLSPREVEDLLKEAADRREAPGGER